jgi:hypothetical protein
MKGFLSGILLVVLSFGSIVTHAQVQEPTILNPKAKWKFKTEGPRAGILGC